MRIRTRCLYLLTAVFICCTSSAFATSTLVLTPSGDNAFLLQGTGVEDAAALDITITYDASALANPRVAQGGLIAGAMMAVNTNVPGSIRIAIIRTTPISGTGAIVTLTFDRKGGSVVRTPTFRASFSNINGAPVPVLAQSGNPADANADAPSETGTQDSHQRPAAGAAASTGSQVAPSVYTGPGVVVEKAPQVAERPPLSNDAPGEEKRSEPATPDLKPASGPEGGSTGASARSPEPASQPTTTLQGKKKKVLSYKSVLKKFQEYRGERTEKKFITLFEQQEIVGFKQEPLVALSDGKAVLKIVLVAMTEGGKAPVVKLQGALLITLEKDADNTNTWIIKARPAANVHEALLSVLLPEMTMEFPLAVAPKISADLDGSGKVTEKDFEIYLKRQASTAEKIDLNKDKKIDALDDYIFTANYLAARLKTEKDKSKGK